MLLELHILQNFAPNNLNRDDTGSPKDCEFGGYRRARVSSQCFKRAMRDAMKSGGLLQPDDLAERTKRLMETLRDRFTKQYSKDPVEAEAVARTAIAAAGLKLEGNNKTQFLLFLGVREIDSIVTLCLERWDDLKGDVAPPADDAAPTKGRKKAPPAPTVSPELTQAFQNLLDGKRAADLALFGRMIAKPAGHNVDGSCQVAHALSTNAVNVEFDFYTAVDDLRLDDAPGADMLGTIEFSSACFYRYLNLDVDQLAVNLGGDADLTKRSVEAFIRAAVVAVPTGKQNSMAAQNPPSLVLAVVRDHGLWSLANAFVEPVRPHRAGDLITHSIKKLDGYWGALTTMYGQKQIVGAWLCTLVDDADAAPPLNHLKSAVVPSLDDVISAAMKAVL